MKSLDELQKTLSSKLQSIFEAKNNAKNLDVSTNAEPIRQKNEGGMIESLTSGQVPNNIAEHETQEVRTENATQYQGMTNRKPRYIPTKINADLEAIKPQTEKAVDIKKSDAVKTLQVCSLYDFAVNVITQCYCAGDWPESVPVWFTLEDICRSANEKGFYITQEQAQGYINILLELPFDINRPWLKSLEPRMNIEKNKTEYRHTCFYYMRDAMKIYQSRANISGRYK